MSLLRPQSNGRFYEITDVHIGLANMLKPYTWKRVKKEKKKEGLYFAPFHLLLQS